MKFKFLLAFLLINYAAGLFAVEWPQEEKGEDAILSYFGQNIDGRISKSLIFSEPAQVSAIKDGRLLIVMSDIQDDSEFFPSALGSSVIIAHDDDLVSVYANLDKETLEVKEGDPFFAEGQLIAQTGNSGWQQDMSGLEFQIIDSQKTAAINPKILLPRVENEKKYNLTSLVIKNKEGSSYDLRENKVFPSGFYRIYHARNKTAVPYKITATINGVHVDEIDFDTIAVQNGKLYVSGKEGEKLYTAEELYPDSNLILCGEFMLSPGKSTLAINVEDFLGKSNQISYILSIY